MELKSIDIKYYRFARGESTSNDGLVHIKKLPYLSVVQAKIGEYGIKLGEGKEYKTGEGGIFIAPSDIMQKITHFQNKKLKKFKLRFVFLDVIINGRYRLDDIFEFPAITDSKETEFFDKCFDEYENADNLCDKMACLYKIVGELIKIGIERERYRNREIYPVIAHISENYMNKITISDMAEIMQMSESNFHAVFKKATGTSPVKYLNDYRLNIAGGLLLQTNKSIKEICESVGIDDQFYFSKLFKAKYEISPREYKKINLY